jgi:hypothetical protein
MNSSFRWIVDNLWITLGVFGWVESWSKGRQKEKKKETPLRSRPMYIRLSRQLRQALGFPLPDCFRD